MRCNRRRRPYFGRSRSCRLHRRLGHHRACGRLRGNRRSRGRSTHNRCRLAGLRHNPPWRRLGFHRRRCHRGPRRRGRSCCWSRGHWARRLNRRRCRLHRRGTRRRSRCRGSRFLLALLNRPQYVARLRNLRPVNLWLDFRFVPLCRAGPSAASPRQGRAHTLSLVSLKRTGVGLLLGNSDFRQYVQNRSTLDF